MELRGILPVKFWPPPKPTKYEQLVIVNWLATEVPHKAMPILDELSRWRNREVYFWIADHREEYYARYMDLL